MRRDEILEKLSELVKDEEMQMEVAVAADKLFPNLEELLDSKTEFKIEDLVMAYADANRRSGFVDGFNAATLLLCGGERLLISGGDISRVGI